MRAWLISVMIMAGCLHAQEPTLPRATTPAQKEFAHLMYDAETIEAAARFVSDHQMDRYEWYDTAKSAYLAFLKIEAYDTAGEIAWRFRFDPIYVGFALRGAHRDAKKRIARYRKGMYEEDSGARRLEAIWSVNRQTLIACRYSSAPAAGDLAIKDALKLQGLTWNDETLYPLLDFGCPVGPPLRDRIINSAMTTYRYEFAIRHAVAAQWSPEDNLSFVTGFFFYPLRCNASFLAVTAFKIKPADVIPLVEASNCESGRISSDGWTMRIEDASSYFFAAVRGGKYNLALELLPFGDFDANAPQYVFQEATRSGQGGAMVKATGYHPEYQNAFMQYAYDQGKYRFVGMSALTSEWERKAFDKLLEIGKWDFAAEVAQYGVDADFRTKGIILAFHAAMAAGDFKAGRYLLARYGSDTPDDGIITRKMFDKDKAECFARKKAQSGASPAPKKRHREREPPTCDGDDWCVKTDK